MAKLLDRFITGDGETVLRVQHSRTGEVIDVHLPNQSDGVRELAASFWGGADVPYVVRDGRAVLDCDPYTMSEAELIELDRADEIRHARELAPGATDAEITAVLNESMSHNQRTAALQALARDARGGAK